TPCQTPQEQEPPTPQDQPEQSESLGQLERLEQLEQLEQPEHLEEAEQEDQPAAHCVTEIRKNVYTFPGKTDDSIESLSRQIEHLRPHYISPEEARAHLARRNGSSSVHTFPAQPEEPVSTETQAERAEPQFVPEGVPDPKPQPGETECPSLPQPSAGEAEALPSASAEVPAEPAPAEPADDRSSAVQEVFANFARLNNCAVSKWTWWVLVNAWVRLNGPRIVVDDLAAAVGKDRKMVNDALMILNKAGVIKIDKSKDEQGSRRMIISRTVELKLNGEWGTETLFGAAKTAGSE
ncbi:MAG: hypothetical protein SOZ52_04045, partial [Pyramidobacter sp.]|nr:hypothetical protein [Pyramidobacter sp.]